MKNLVKEENLMSNHVLTVITQIMVMAVVICIILLFIGIGILILIHLCLVGRAFRRSLTMRTMSVDRGVASEVHGASASSNVEVVNRNGGLSMEEVQNLPSFKYHKHGGKKDGVFVVGIDNHEDNGLDCSECAVCLDGFQVGEKCRVLPTCRHSFHAKCVDAWLCRRPLCPICRTNAEVRMEEEAEKGVDRGLANGRGYGSGLDHVSQTLGNHGSDFQYVSQTPSNHEYGLHNVSHTTANDGPGFNNVFHTHMNPISPRSPPPRPDGDDNV